MLLGKTLTAQLCTGSPSSSLSFISAPSFFTRTMSAGKVFSSFPGQKSQSVKVLFSSVLTALSVLGLDSRSFLVETKAILLVK